MSSRIATCPSCGAKYRIPETFTKPRALCKKCGTAVDVPPVDAAAEAAHSPPPAAPEKKRPPAEPTRPRRTTKASRGAKEDETEPRSARGGRKSGARRSSARSKAGGAHGAVGRGRSRRRGEDEEMEGGGNPTVVILIVAAVVVVVAIAAFFLLQKKDVAPPPTEETSVAQNLEQERAREREAALKRAQEEERRREEAEEARRRAEEEARKPDPAAAKPAEEPTQGRRPPPPKVDLSILAPLEFSPETPPEMRKEILEHAEFIADRWAPAKHLSRAQARFRELGYHAVPALINEALKLDFATKDGVAQGLLFFTLLRDMCPGAPMQFRNVYNEEYDAEAWENEYCINWNEQLVHRWHEIWHKVGGSKEKWDTEGPGRPRKGQDKDRMDD